MSVDEFSTLLACGVRVHKERLCRLVSRWVVSMGYKYWDDRVGAGSVSVPDDVVACPASATVDVLERLATGELHIAYSVSTGDIVSFVFPLTRTLVISPGNKCYEL